MDSLQFTKASAHSFTVASQGRQRKIKSIGQRKRKCEFCTSIDASYTCSQCDLPFCSSECFRSEKHRECSELFYKKCVLDHMKSTKTNKEEQERFIELLKRNSQATNEDILDYVDLLNETDDGGGLDSINLDLLKDPRLQQFSEKLATHLGDSLSGENLVDLDRVWLELSSAEQAEFIEIVNGNGKLFDELIREWKPWWWRKEWQQLVVDQEEEDNSDDDEESLAFPQLYSAVQPISSLTSKTPSPTIGNAIISTLFAYAHLCRLYNGEIACCDPEAPAEDLDPRWSPDIALELFRLCPLLDSQSPAATQPPANASQALELSLACLFASSTSVTVQQKMAAIELFADLQIFFDFTGKPGRTLTIRDSSIPPKTIHAPKAITLALSDLIHILSEVHGSLKKTKIAKSEAKKLHQRIELARRKLTFYLSWSLEFGESALGDGYLQAIQLEISKLNQENLLFEQDCEQVYEKTVNRTNAPKGPLIEELN